MKPALFFPHPPRRCRLVPCFSPKLDRERGSDHGTNRRAAVRHGHAERLGCVQGPPPAVSGFQGLRRAIVWLLVSGIPSRATWHRSTRRSAFRIGTLWHSSTPARRLAVLLSELAGLLGTASRPARSGSGGVSGRHRVEQDRLSGSPLGITRGSYRDHLGSRPSPALLGGLS